jgi:MFS family permease
LGALLFTAAAENILPVAAGFIIAGCLNLAAGLFIAVLIPETNPTSYQHKNPVLNLGSNQKDSWLSVIKDYILWIWITGNALIFGVYDLISTFLPLHLKNNSVPIWVYSNLLLINAFICVFFQLPISKYLAKAAIFKTSFFSKLLYLLGFTIFGYLLHPVFLMLGMIILTFGEVSGASASVRFIPEIAPSGLRGRYYGVAGFMESGKVIITLLAGYIMEHWNGKLLFSCAAILAVIGGAIMWLADFIYLKRIQTIKQ